MFQSRRDTEPIRAGDLAPNRATICLVNYKTLEFTRLCLRSIRRFTRYPHEVIVVDNDSRDASLDYLRGLGWIRLLERPGCRETSGGDAHAAAMDLALAHCRTEFLVMVHSDTFIHHDGWLTELIARFQNDTTCVGSGKLDRRPPWLEFLRKRTDIKIVMRRLCNPYLPEGKYRYYNRTLCCVYRTRVLLEEGLSFAAGRDIGLTPGKQLYFDLVDRGYPTVELPNSVMSRYVWHLGHATDPVRVYDLKRRKRTIRKRQRRLKWLMGHRVMQDLLADASLDRGPVGRELA